MKTRIITTIILCFSGLVLAQNINPTWRPVGPFSDNDIPSNLFKTGQIDGIAVDPTTPNHILVSSFYAGIWETNNDLNDKV